MGGGNPFKAIGHVLKALAPPVIGAYFGGIPGAALGGLLGSRGGNRSQGSQTESPPVLQSAESLDRQATRAANSAMDRAGVFDFRSVRP